MSTYILVNQVDFLGRRKQVPRGVLIKIFIQPVRQRLAFAALQISAETLFSLLIFAIMRSTGGIALWERRRS